MCLLSERNQRLHSDEPESAFISVNVVILAQIGGESVLSALRLFVV
jgi:hypothetical protein